MRYFKLVRYDLGHGLLRKPGRWIATGCLFMALLAIFILDVFHLYIFQLDKDIRNLNTISLSCGDIFITQLGGMLPIRFTDLTKSFQLPVKWLLPHIMILYSTLNYTSDDLSTFGIQILTRAQNKWAWWLSKCIWNVLAVTSCFLLGIGVIYLMATVLGLSRGISLNGDIFAKLMGAELPVLSATNLQYFFSLCIMPCAVCAAVSLMQMTLSLFVKPIISYILACSYYIAGAYYAHPLFISNYAMTVRSATVGIYNFQASSGFLLCAGYGIAAIVIGGLRLNRMDFIIKE